MYVDIVVDVVLTQLAEERNMGNASFINCHVVIRIPIFSLETLTTVMM